jgi:hypothetical protein
MTDSMVEVPDEAGSPDDEPEVADADLPSDEDEDAAPPPDDDSATPADPEAT